MSLEIKNGNCLELMKTIEDKSIDLLICDLPYGETNCKWDSEIDLEEFWKEFKRIRKSKRTACIHFCSTKFGYTLIKSWEKGFKMDMVWKKRNKTGGLQSRHRPMRNHEMVYFFYEQAPKYNRDKYHKRINNQKIAKSETSAGTKSDKFDNENKVRKQKNFNPVQPASVVEEKPHVNIYGLDKSHPTWDGSAKFVPPNPASVLEEHESVNYKTKSNEIHERTKAYMSGNKNLYEPKQPASVVEEKPKKKRNIRDSTRANEKKDIFGYNQDAAKPHQYEPPNPASIVEEPVSMFESTKVFIGKRHHQTEKPQDILEFFLKYWSDEGDMILDPTMGSGSTGVACKKLKRNFIGFELDETIFKVAEKRLNN